MKKNTLLLLFFVLLAIPGVFAQTGLNGINYQAVARNTNGTVLANQPVKVKISVLGGSASGAVQYQESHSLSTNQLGLFTLQIGKGTASTGTFATVPWQNTNQYLKVELAVGSGSYADLATTQLMSVPYALFAANSNPGATGPQGLQGPAGPTGSAGPAGVNGTNGTAGAPGIKGDQGIQGITGAAGAPGAKGDQGIQGITGVAGAPGAKGDQGIQGITGAAGAPGAKGDQGIQGITGAAGAPGAKGDQGIQGIAGVVGAPGANGIDGAAGIAGPIGPVGAQGIAGPKGDPGDMTNSAAGGDLAGAYPNPKVIALQSKPVSNIAPVADQYLKFDGTNWIPAAITGSSAFNLPYSGVSSVDNVVPFSITNNSTSLRSAGSFENTSISNSEPAIIGSNKSEENFGVGVQGLANSNTTSKTSSGVSGQLLGSGKFGAGVFGYAENATGVSGSTGKGVGVSGLSTGAGGYAGLFNGNGGSTALLTIGKLTFQSIGEAAGKVLTSDAVGNATWQLPAAGAAFTLPYGAVQSNTVKPLFSIKNTTGSFTVPAGAIMGESSVGYGVYGKGTDNNGLGVYASSEKHIGLWATTNSPSAAAGYFYSPNTANTQPALVAQAEGTGAAIYGGAKSGTGIMADSETGSAAKFELTNVANPSNVVTVKTGGNGIGVDVETKIGASVRARSNTVARGTIDAINISTNTSSSAVYGSNENGIGVQGISNEATGIGVVASGNTFGTGLAAYSNFGPAAKIYLIQTSNANTVLDVTTAGAGTGVKSTTTKGTAIEGINSSTVSGTYAVRGEMSATNGSVSAGVRGENKNLGSNGYGVYGSHAGAGGTGVYGTVPGNGTGVYGESQGVGAGVYATSIDGIGLRAISQNGTAGTFASGTGLAIQTTKGNVEVNGKLNVNDASTGGQAVNVQTTGAAIAGYFVNLSGSTTSPAVSALTFGTGPALIATAFGAPGTSNVAIFKNNPFVSANPATNVARIDNAGKGFFNGGTQNSGADIAEAFDVNGNVIDFEPGDILVISQDKNRAVEKSSSSYSNLVAGVYATKPGVLLTEEHIDTDLAGKVPMGVIGVIPTKVCLEGGAIKRGDMLVTSSKAGVAMKADLTKVKVGEVLGKALEPFNEAVIQKIKVLVSIK